MNNEGPFSDKRIAHNNVPHIFRNYHLKDVSSDYFASTDVIFELKNIPKNEKYCYLAVFGLGEWHPVQWGKINKNKVLFTDMGRDILYMPVYYKNNNIEIAGNPFYLDETGNVHLLSRSEKNGSISSRGVKSFILPAQRFDDTKPLKWSYVLGSKDIHFTNTDTLFRVQHTMDTWFNEVIVKDTVSCRYIRLESLYDEIALCEIRFFTSQGDVHKSLKTKIVHTNVSPTDSLSKIDHIIDDISASGFKGKAPSNEMKAVIDFDLGDVYAISKVEYVPLIASDVPPSSKFELFYWDGKWELAGIVTGEPHYITFLNVPQNCLYLIKDKTRDLKSRERIFIYKDGMVRWM